MPDKRVNKIRAEEIAATGCDTVAIGCPFCSIMVKDGLDSVGSNMDVKDVAELLWEQIVAKDEEIQSSISYKFIRETIIYLGTSRPNMDKEFHIHRLESTKNCHDRRKLTNRMGNTGLFCMQEL